MFASHGCSWDVVELYRDCGISAAAEHTSDGHRTETCTKSEIVQVPDVISGKKAFYVILNALPRRVSPSLRIQMISSKISHEIIHQIFLTLY